MDPYYEFLTTCVFNNACHSCPLRSSCIGYQSLQKMTLEELQEFISELDGLTGFGSKLMRLEEKYNEIRNPTA